MKPGIITSKGHAHLDQKIEQALRSRLQNKPNFDSEEIAKVSSLDCSLFPKDFVLDQTRNEEYRILARSAQLELKPAREIRSHRKYLGKLIVLIKRASWPFIRIHLKDTVEHMRDFSSQALYTMARQEVSLRKLERR